MVGTQLQSGWKGTIIPEGSEVKRWTEGLNESLAQKTVKTAKVVGGRYMRVDPVLLGLSKLEGAKIDRITCKGKLIVFHMKIGDEAFAALSTLGMTGWWIPDYTESDSTFDKYKKISIEFTDGTFAVFFDPRNFGTFKIVSYAEMKRKLAELGPDILTPENLWEAITLPEFYKRVRRFGKNLTLAEALLDQRIACGCGNYIRADAMYLAGMSPHRLASGLTDAELKLIWKAMNEIATLSLEQDGEYESICYGRESVQRGHAVEAYTDKHGRTVWWCPTEQVL